MVRLGLFGTFSVSGDIEPVRGAIPQAVLARLALAAGAPVGTDELVADLWYEPPSTVVSSLRAHISRLRTRGWGELLAHGRVGYRLAIEPDDVDVLRYGMLVAGDAALDDLTAAERLWTGAPLASLRDFPFAASVIARLERVRRTAVMALAELRLAIGESTAAVALLSEYAAAHRLDGDVVALHARALARSGRTTDALDVLDAFGGGAASPAHASRTHGSAHAPLERPVAADGGSGAELARLRAAIVRQDPLVLGPGTLDPERTVERIGIPFPLTRFVGRERELEIVRQGREQSRLVTLIGAAGVGKTRLAVEVARRSGPDVDDTQRLIDLATVPAPAQVLGAVADALGASGHEADAIARTLAGRRVLLVLDNAEHVLGAVATLCAALLARCDGLSVLVTSREAMRMAGERVIVIEPLLGAASGDAVTLFLQRATDASGITAWSDADMTRVRELCRTLDGLPLAIELAAARLDVLSVGELAASLDTPARRQGGRHDSIDDAIAWSTRLAGDAERRMLSQLVLFSGSFTLEAVAEICDAGDADARELTVSLARRSLVSVLAAESGERRFRVLEAVRRHVTASAPYAAVDEWRRRHGEVLTEIAERRLPSLRTADVRRVKATLGAWRPDFDAALTRLIARGERRGAVRLVAALAWYWYERGLGADAVGAIERALALPGDDAPDAEAAALHAAAFLRAVGTEPLETVRMTRRFAAAADRCDEAAWPALAHVMLAYLAAGADDVDEAEAQLALSADAATRIGENHSWARADVLMIRGDALRLLRRPAQALDVLEESYRIATESGHTWAAKGSCFVTGKVLTEVGRPRDAVAILRTGAIRSLESDDPTSAFAAINAAGAAFVRLDRSAHAVTLFAAVDHAGARFAYHPQGSDGVYTAQAVESARRALSTDEWDAAYARGRAMDLRAVMEFLAAFR